jgi:hypothetical protein
MPELWPHIEEISEYTELSSRLAKVETEPVVADSTVTATDAPLSALILNEIRRSSATSALKGQTLKPGTIVLIDARRDLHGHILQKIAYPVAFCLERSQETTSTNDGQVWTGWIAAPEIDYATCWDVLLEPGDEPFDPKAGMVQTWNPLAVWLPKDARILAILSPERLAAIQEVARKAHEGVQDGESAQPGYVHLRETGAGSAVLTGTPLDREVSDPRAKYQTLYRNLAQSLAATAANQPRFGAKQTITQWIARNRQQSYALAASLLIAVAIFSTMTETKKEIAPPITVAQAPVQPLPSTEISPQELPQVEGGSSGPLSPRKKTSGGGHTPAACSIFFSIKETGINTNHASKRCSGYVC